MRSSLRRHEKTGLVANPPADVSTINRRLSLDLHGLPPDPSTLGDELHVDDLLADPAYGQRWARHWLDVARWAESNGHQHNRGRPHAWRYRDWVVDAFNAGKPFDDFLREQIAGDEISPYVPENLIATGFLAAARYSGNELDKQIQRNDVLVDVANTTASAFLGADNGMRRMSLAQVRSDFDSRLLSFPGLFCFGPAAKSCLAAGRRPQSSCHIADPNYSIESISD